MKNLVIQWKRIGLLLMSFLAGVCGMTIEAQADWGVNFTWVPTPVMVGQPR